MRLAYEQGLFKQQDLNAFQHWALTYWIYMDRRIHGEDKQFEFEQQCWHLNPERWATLYYERFFGDTVAAGEEQELPVNNIDEIDRFMASLQGKRWATGADFSNDQYGDQYGEWI